MSLLYNYTNKRSNSIFDLHSMCAVPIAPVRLLQLQTQSDNTAWNPPLCRWLCEGKERQERSVVDLRRPLGFNEYIIKTKSSHIIRLGHQLTKIGTRIIVSYTIGQPHSDTQPTLTVEHQTRNETAFEPQAGPMKSFFFSSSTWLQDYHKFQHTPTCITFLRELTELDSNITEH